MILLEVVTLKGKPIGLVAATSKNCVGYSLYNPVKEKRSWDLGLATKIAVGRAEKVITPLFRLLELMDMFKTQEDKGGQVRTRLMIGKVNRMIKKAKRLRW